MPFARALKCGVPTDPLLPLRTRLYDQAPLPAAMAKKPPMPAWKGNSGKVLFGGSPLARSLSVPAAIETPTAAPSAHPGASSPAVRVSAQQSTAAAPAPVESLSDVSNIKAPPTLARKRYSIATFPPAQRQTVPFLCALGCVVLRSGASEMLRSESVETATTQDAAASVTAHDMSAATADVLASVLSSDDEDDESDDIALPCDGALAVVFCCRDVVLTNWLM